MFIIAQISNAEEKCDRVLLSQKVCVVVVVGEFLQERPWLENKGWKNNLGQIHPRSDLLDQEPDDRLVLVGDLLGLETKF